MASKLEKKAEHAEAEDDGKEYEYVVQLPNTGKLTTAPVDPRFATTINKAKYCWTSYNEWLQCVKMNDGKNTPECKKAEKIPRTMCPNAWQTEWRNARAEGRFYGVQQGLTEEEELQMIDREEIEFPKSDKLKIIGWTRPDPQSHVVRRRRHFRRTGEYLSDLDLSDYVDAGLPRTVPWPDAVQKPHLYKDNDTVSTDDVLIPVRVISGFPDDKGEVKYSDLSPEAMSKFVNPDGKGTAGAAKPASSESDSESDSDSSDDDDDDDEDEDDDDDDEEEEEEQPKKDH